MSRKSASYTSEFQHEYATQTGMLLSRRFRWFTGVMGGLGLLSTALILVFVIANLDDATPDVAGHPINGKMYGTLATFVMWSMLYVGGFIYAWARKREVRRLVTMSITVVVIDGLINIAMRVFNLPFATGLFGFVLSFTIATCFLPWSVRQALTVAAIVLGVDAILKLSHERGMSFNTLFAVLMTSLFVLPGIFISWFRSSSRLRTSQFYFLQRRYGEVRQELTDARRIHEAMFPAPMTKGDVRFTYRYQPMRQIGGDYLHINTCPNENGSAETLSVVVLDVTGHGIPAALTVNRLYGELARLYAEDPFIEPGEVLALLNRYVRLTMASHSVFVTGLVVKIDPSTHTMIYANAGHPPAFHLRADGSIDQIDSTTFLLGAVDDETFDASTQTIEFMPGDRVIAYTDGATEARNSDGKMLGIVGMQGILASTKTQGEGAWPATLLGHVDDFRNGPPDDDTLVIEVYRPLSSAKPKPSKQRARESSAQPVNS